MMMTEERRRVRPFHFSYSLLLSLALYSSPWNLNALLIESSSGVAAEQLVCMYEWMSVCMYVCNGCMYACNWSVSEWTNQRTNVCMFCSVLSMWVSERIREEYFSQSVSNRTFSLSLSLNWRLTRSLRVCACYLFVH